MTSERSAGTLATGGVAVVCASLLLLGGCRLLMLPIRAVASLVDVVIKNFPLFGLFAASQPIDLPSTLETPTFEAAVQMAPLEPLARAIPENMPITATLYLVDPNWVAACESRAPVGRAIDERHAFVSRLGWRDAASLVARSEDTRHFLDTLRARGVEVRAIGPAGEAFLARAR